ncbi:hypothetical protein ACO0LG_14925 [Undibacterium sp. Ji42W]|uniref:hypothetical protein n=1 Tax=Undibacterium sp. Ji42W TaxID=3413039 RepID=UPI003BF02688
MKKSMLAIILAAVAVAGHAADAVRLGQELKSAAGVEKIIALAEGGKDTYWISTFVRDGNCPEKSGKCSNDAMTVRGPGGVTSVSVEDASGAGGYLSQTKNQVAVVLLPANKGGYVYASAEVYIFGADKKPQSALKTAEVLLNNLEGAACQGKKLCADSKFAVSFPGAVTSDYPDVVLHQTGTALNQAGTALEKLDRNFSFTFDAKTRQYIAKR